MVDWGCCQIGVVGLVFDYIDDVLVDQIVCYVFGCVWIGVIILGYQFELVMFVGNDYIVLVGFIQCQLYVVVYVVVYFYGGVV